MAKLFIFAKKSFEWQIVILLSLLKTDKIKKRGKE